MVDATELDYLRTFISKVCTLSTVKHVVENGADINQIVDASKQRILVKQGEEILSISNRYIKRFKILISQPTEVLMMDTIRNLIDCIKDHNLRLAFGSYTYEPTLVFIEFISGNVGSINYKTSRWDNQIILDVTFLTS